MDHISDFIERFCDDGAFKERRKPRRVARNVYDTEKVSRIVDIIHSTRCLILAQERLIVLPIDMLRGNMSGSYSLRCTEDGQRLADC